MLYIRRGANESTLAPLFMGCMTTTVTNDQVFSPKDSLLLSLSCDYSFTTCNQRLRLCHFVTGICKPLSEMEDKLTADKGCMFPQAFLAEPV